MSTSPAPRLFGGEDEPSQDPSQGPLEPSLQDQLSALSTASIGAGRRRSVDPETIAKLGERHGYTASQRETAPTATAPSAGPNTTASLTDEQAPAPLRQPRATSPATTGLLDDSAARLTTPGSNAMQELRELRRARRMQAAPKLKEHTKVQLNVRIRVETMITLHEIAQHQGLTLVEGVERAVILLQREASRRSGGR